MRIIMTGTQRGTEDGFTIQEFLKDVCYDVRDNLAAAFLAAGKAEIADIPYVNLAWKSGNVTRQPMTDTVSYFINKGVARISEEI